METEPVRLHSLKLTGFALQESNGIFWVRHANVKAHHFRDVHTTRIPATTRRSWDNVGHYSVAQCC
jgi:hypothetical protein